MRWLGLLFGITLLGCGADGPGAPEDAIGDAIGAEVADATGGAETSFTLAKCSGVGMQMLTEKGHGYCVNDGTWVAEIAWFESTARKLSIVLPERPTKSRSYTFDEARVWAYYFAEGGAWGRWRVGCGVDVQVKGDAIRLSFEASPRLSGFVPGPSSASFEVPSSSPVVSDADVSPYLPEGGGALVTCADGGASSDAASE
ncbi:MAG: hypothetical protein IPJ34_08760 [Myxococcales bacterium]|nr:hypothetical protein [Myxococcales bacterium]